MKIRQSDEEYERLEERERETTLELIAAMLLTMDGVQNDLEKELLSFYNTYGKDGIVSYQEARKFVSDQDHRRRLTVLTATIVALFDGALEKLNSKFNTLVDKIFKHEADFFDIDLETTRHPKWGVDNSDWSSRLAKDVGLWKYNIHKDIIQELIKRSDVKSILSKVAKRFATIKHVIRRLTITESTAIGSIARKEIFNKLKVKKYRFFTRADERTCEECGALHGKVFPISAYQVGVTASPIHANCRCFEIPIFN